MRSVVAAVLVSACAGCTSKPGMETKLNLRPSGVQPATASVRTAIQKPSRKPARHQPRENEKRRGELEKKLRECYEEFEMIPRGPACGNHLHDLRAELDAINKKLESENDPFEFADVQDSRDRIIIYFQEYEEEGRIWVQALHKFEAERAAIEAELEKLEPRRRAR